MYKNGYIVDAPAIGSKFEKAPHGPAIAKYLLLNIKKKEFFYGAGTPTSALMIRRDNVKNVGGLTQNSEE